MGAPPPLLLFLTGCVISLGASMISQPRRRRRGNAKGRDSKAGTGDRVVRVGLEVRPLLMCSPRFFFVPRRERPPQHRSVSYVPSAPSGSIDLFFCATAEPQHLKHGTTRYTHAVLQLEHPLLTQLTNNQTKPRKRETLNPSP